LIDAALVDQILQEAAYGIVGEGGDDRGVQAEAAFESASDIVFAPPSQTSKERRGGDAFFRRGRSEP